MGDVIMLRPRPPAYADPAAAAHPSLRWIAGDAYGLAHRRAHGVPACGAPGELVLASRGVPLCDECWPGR